MDNIAIVIHSCDKYQFVWERWAKCFQGCLATKEIPVYFLSEELKNPHFKMENYNFRGLRTGPGEWSDRLIRAFDTIKEEHIFYMQEDMFPRTLLQEWHFSLFQSILTTMGLDALQVSPNCKYYTLSGNSFPSQPIPVEYFLKESDYLVSHQPRLWKRKFLLRCLEPGESPWTNEIQGTKRIRKLRPRIGFIEWDWYQHMVKKGKWIE